MTDKANQPIALDTRVHLSSTSPGTTSRKQYFGYFRGKRSFFTIEVQRQRLLLYLSLDPATAKPWNDEVMRDVREIGHYGMGDVESHSADPRMSMRPAS